MALTDVVIIRMAGGGQIAQVDSLAGDVENMAQPTAAAKTILRGSGNLDEVFLVTAGQDQLRVLKTTIEGADVTTITGHRVYAGERRAFKDIGADEVLSIVVET
ncbi:MAG: hypothetical protein AAF674_16880 [Pseudomonadota bacterium]